MGGNQRINRRGGRSKTRQFLNIFPFVFGMLLAAACSAQADLAPRPWPTFLGGPTGSATAEPVFTPSFRPTRTATPFLPVTNTPVPTPRILTPVPDLGATQAAATQVEDATRMAAISLPDLQTLPPTDVRLVADWSTGRMYVRFSNAILNAGPGPLELIGRPDLPAGVIRVDQRIYTPEGEIAEERPFGEFVFHPYHNHWHLEDFASYEVWSLGQDRQLEAVVGTGNKVSYCVTDMERAPVDDPAVEVPTRRVYTNCWGELQGLSSHWVDIYNANLYGQWVEITGLEDGIYALVATVDPENLILEGDDDNNVGLVYFELANARLTLTEKPPVILPNKIK